MSRKGGHTKEERISYQEIKNMIPRKREGHTKRKRENKGYLLLCAWSPKEKEKVIPRKREVKPKKKKISYQEKDKPFQGK